MKYYAYIFYCLYPFLSKQLSVSSNHIKYLIKVIFNSGFYFHLKLFDQTDKAFSDYNNRKAGETHMTRQQDPLTMDFILLGIIQQKPTHAYDLYRTLTGSEELKTLWTFRQSRLYAVLDKIEKNGLISTSIDQESSLPVRKICTLTAEGESVFENWLHNPVEHMNEIRSDFLGKLYFLKDRPEPERKAVIEAQIYSCRKWQESIEKKLKQHPEPDDFLHIVYSFRAEFIRSTLHWLETL